MPLSNSLSSLIVKSLCLALLLSACKNRSKDPLQNTSVQKDANKIKVAFYNCENFFDTHHQPGKQDEDFTPDGKYHYTQKVYEQKLHNIATVLQSMSSNGGELAIAGLAEIENDRVLNDLCNQPELGDKHLKHICHNGPDPRGINVAFIYDPALFILIKEETIPVIFTGTGHSSHGRDILHVYGILDGDTVHVFVNHWTSRRKGEDESERKRVQAAQANKDAIDGLMRTDPNTKVIVMGDFNDNPTDRSIAQTLAANDDPERTKQAMLYNPFTAFDLNNVGTEKYRSSWNLFDQIIISAAFLQNSPQHLHFDLAKIYSPQFIIDDRKKGHNEPHRSFVGSRWINGYSDHFPVLIELNK